MNSDLIEAEGFTQKDANEKGESISLVDFGKLQSEMLKKEEQSNKQAATGAQSIVSPNAISVFSGDRQQKLQ